MTLEYLPHATDPVAGDAIATNIMRQWMEQVSQQQDSSSESIDLLLACKFDSIVRVSKPEDFGTIDSTKVYVIDGIVDMRGITQTVPPTGMYIFGFGFDISQLICDEDNYTMFDGGGGFFVNPQGCTFTASGTNSKVFDMTDPSGFNAVEFNFVNFSGCTSIGELNGFRQILMRNVGVFGCSDGLTFSGTMNGLKATDVIIRSSQNIFNEGASLSVDGRFGGSFNIDLPSGISHVCDFDPSVFSTTSSFQLTECFISRGGTVDVSDANYFPNITNANRVSFWRDNTGIPDTNIGGSWTIANSGDEASTTISTVGTFVKIAGTTTYKNLEHFDQNTSNAFRLDDEQTRRCDIDGVIVIEQDVGTGATIRIRVRYFRAATSTYEDGETFSSVVPNLVGGLDDVTNVTIKDRTDLDDNDRVELWISNESSTSNLTMKVSSILTVKRV